VKKLSIVGVLTVTGLALLVLAGAGPRRQGGAGSAVPTEARSLMRARVTSVDATTGRIALAGDDTTLDAVFAPRVAAGIRPGDIVFVTLNVIGSRRAAVTGTVASVDAERNTATFALPHGRGDCAKRVSEGGGSATRRHRPDQARSRRHRSTIGPIALTGGSLGGGGIATSRNAGVYAWRRLEP